MIGHDIFLPAPLPVLSTGTMVMLLAIAWRRNVIRSLVIAVVTLLAALVSVSHAFGTPPADGTSLFVQDRWAIYTAVLILLSILCIVFMSWRDLVRDAAHPTDEYPLLMMLCTIGATSMVFSASYMPFFLGVEILGISLMGLIASRHYRFAQATEAAMKYLILSGVSSAILLFGMGLAYGVSGSLAFVPPVAAAGFAPSMAQVATVMILAGMFFKLSAVPFHMWLPDVMEGAPPPIAAFTAVTAKIAIFASLVRYFGAAPLPPFLQGVIYAVIILTIMGGNLLALCQNSLTRLMACSSIAHMGYLLIAFFSPGRLQGGAMTVYLVAYTVSTLGVFTIICACAPAMGQDGNRITAWKGLFATNPLPATAMSVMLLSLAGIPPTIGFFAKFEIAGTGVELQRDVLLLVLVIGSIIGLYYYLNIIRVMMNGGAAPSLPIARQPQPELTALTIVLTIIVIMGGLFPGPALYPLLPATVKTMPARNLTGTPPEAPIMKTAIAPPAL